MRVRATDFFERPAMRKSFPGFLLVIAKVFDARHASPCTVPSAVFVCVWPRGWILVSVDRCEDGQVQFSLVPNPAVISFDCCKNVCNPFVKCFESNLFICCVRSVGYVFIYTHVRQKRSRMTV